MRKLLATLLVVMLAGQAAAREVEGVTLPDQVSVAGTTLTMNGMGVRTKFFVKAYVAAFYLESPTHDAKAAVTSNQPKRMQLVLLRDLSKDQLSSSLREGFEANAGPRMPQLRERMELFDSVLQSGKRGDWLTVTYEPGRGTVVVNSNGVTKVIPGKDFADVLFAVWLGTHPVDEGLKKELLGI